MIEIQGPELEFGRILNNPHHLYKNKTDDGQKLWVHNAIGEWFLFLFLIF